MPGSPSGKIRDVWADNLEEEMAVIAEVVQQFPYVAMDTEFPGVVARPIGQFGSAADYQFQSLRCNVDLLKLIQLGLTFADAEGNYPDDVCTWQFNFKFNLQEDMYAQDSIDLLQRSGIDFQQFEERGIDIDVFGELFMVSGVVLTPEVKWLTFHAGYDFGYLLKALIGQALPTAEPDWFALVRLFFTGFYDLKYVMKHVGMKGGLSDLADDLRVDRIGPQHQAGSDSLLTSLAFFELRKQHFSGSIEDRLEGVLFGLGVSSADASMHGVPLNTPTLSSQTVPSSSSSTSAPPSPSPAGSSIHNNPS